MFVQFKAQRPWPQTPKDYPYSKLSIWTNVNFGHATQSWTDAILQLEIMYFINHIYRDLYAPKSAVIF